MGILGAMQTAVSGMQAQAYALDNISGNIANSQTIGFKESLRKTSSIGKIKLLLRSVPSVQDKPI